MSRNVDRVVIVGAVAAGLSAASRAKRAVPGTEVIVLEESEFVSVSLCNLPYYISGEVKGRESLIAVPLESLKRERGLDVRIRHKALGISPTSKTVTCKDLEADREYELRYDKLVLATGAVPVVPRLSGTDARNVFVLHSIPDAEAIREHLQQRGARNAVVVGGGFIGLEMAEAFAKRGLSVTIVEMLPNVLGTMDDEITSVVQDHLRAQGVTLVLNSPLRSIEVGEDGLARAVVAGSREYPADVVLLSVGVRPRVEIAREAGIRLGQTGAIATDWKQKTSEESIFAAGDCCETRDVVTDRMVYVPLGTTANKQGRVAGENAAGGYATFRGIVGTTIARSFEISFGRAGLTQKEAKALGLEFETVVINAKSRASHYPGSETIRIKLVFERAGGRLLGAQVVGKDGVLARLDVLACAIFARLTVEEAARFDLAYAPPFAPAWDPVLVALNAARKKVKSR